MIDLQSRTGAGTSSAKSSRHRRATQSATVALVALGGALVGALSGCSLVEPGVSLSQARQFPATQPVTVAPVAMPVETIEPPVTPTAADVMFQSTDGPAPIHGSTVNVFGEVGGHPASPFASAQSAGSLQQQTYLDEGYDADPCVSRDGKWIVYASTRHSEHPDIYLQHTDGLAVIQLTADEGDDAYPRFSRDGKQITFSSNRAGNWDIYTMDADGTHVRQITRSAAQEIHSSFNPDGTRLVYSSLGARSGQWELWTIDLRSDERRMIGYGLFPDWSPRADKDVIAFQRARQRGTRWFSAWTLDLIEGEARDVAEIAYSGTNAIVAPTWSADGTRLAFCTIADPEAKTPDKTGDKPTEKRQPRQDVWTVNADGTDRMRLTDGKGENAMPTWSRDGRIYFVSDRGGAECIWSTATSMPRTLAAVAPEPEETPVAVMPPAEAPVHAARQAASVHAAATIETPTMPEVPAVNEKPEAPAADAPETAAPETPMTEAPRATEAAATPAAQTPAPQSHEHEPAASSGPASAHAE